MDLHGDLGGGFKHFLFSPLPGEMIQFDFRTIFHSCLFFFFKNHQLEIDFVCFFCWKDALVAW